MSARRQWVWGDRSFWIDETLNDMLALSDRFVAAVGHARIFVWDVRDGAQVRTFARFLRPEQAWFEGERLCLRAGGRVLVCDVGTGEMHEREAGASSWPEVSVRSYTVVVQWPGGQALEWRYPNEPIGRVSCALGGERIAVGHGLRSIDVRDGRTGEVVHRISGAGNGVLAPDGRRIAVGDLGTRRVRVVPVDVGEVPPHATAGGEVEGLKISPDGGRVLVVAGGVGWVLRVADGAPLVRLAPAGGEHVDERSAWTADGRAIVGPVANQVVRWDADSGAVVRCFEIGPRMQAERFAADAQGERVVIVGATYPGGLMLVPGEEAVVWDVARGEVVARVPLEDFYSESVELAPDGRRLALVHAEGVRVVTLPDEVERRAPAGWCGFAGASWRLREEEDGRFTVVRVRGGAVIGAWPVGPIRAFAADEAGFAVARPDETIAVHAGEDLAVRAVIEAPGRATALALRGAWLIAGGWDATVHAFAVDR